MLVPEQMLAGLELLVDHPVELLELKVAVAEAGVDVDVVELLRRVGAAEVNSVVAVAPPTEE